MRETIKQLQERWTSEITMRTLEDAEPRSPFGRLPSGLWDFRGFGDFDWRERLRSQGLADHLIVDYLKRSCIESMNGMRFVEFDLLVALLNGANLLERCFNEQVLHLVRSAIVSFTTLRSNMHIWVFPTRTREEKPFSTNAFLNAVSLPELRSVHLLS